MPQDEEGPGVSRPVLGAAFIDDEALVLVARRGDLLDEGIEVLLSTVFNVFESLHLQIHHAGVGKTEALLAYRGKGCVGRREARRCADGKLRLQVPERAVAIEVVESYKHLGTYVSLRAASMANAGHRATSAMAAYSPIAQKVFGSALVPLVHKLIFARTLLCTRLLYGVYVLVPTPRQLQRLSQVYMVVLRRFADEPRFGRTEHTDREVRELLGQPAIECVISRMRLLYAARLNKHRTAALLAVLHARTPKGRHPWVKQLLRDSELLRPFLPEGFPGMDACREQWRSLMREEAGWRALVARVHVVPSECNREAGRPDEEAAAHECHCGKACCSSVALRSHQRSAHGARL